MPRVVGIDPGSLSYDLCGLAGGDVFLERSLPTSEVARDPEPLLRVLEQAAPLDLIAGPSGYGLPLIPVERTGERELRLMCLARPGDSVGVGGLRTLVRRLRESRLPVVFTPGVVHLPTVPTHRKANRIDLGTADKVCVAAAAIAEQARRLDLPYVETGFVLVELGGAFTAVLSVDGGRVVNGQGGSSGPLGYRACGALDAEVACLLGVAGVGLDKGLVFSGGVAFLAGDPEASPEALASRDDEASRLGKDALVDSVARAVAGELTTLGKAREILLSGRLSRVAGFREPVVAALSRLAPVRTLELPGAVKEAAQGAALIADGLAGGRYAALVEAMRLREARGTVLDHLYMRGSQEMRSWALEPARC